MNFEMEVLAALFTGAGGFAAACLCFLKQRQNRQQIMILNKELEEIKIALAANKETLETAARRAADQSRRVAWLETRIRQPKLAKKDVLEETTLSEPVEMPKRLNITERRHRVLSLAGSGQTAETIAATLGMLPGEVELIIGLNRANFAQFT